MSTNPDRMLRLRAVLDQTGLCRSTLYRKMANGTFPKNIQLSTRCVGWRASAVDEWLRNPMFYHVDDYPPNERYRDPSRRSNSVSETT